MTTALTILAVVGFFAAANWRSSRFSRQVGLGFLTLAVAALVALEAVDAFRDAVGDVGAVRVRIDVR